EGRFRSQALLDPGALLTCMVYVDLNPIRAGIADSLEESPFTSIRERLIAAATPPGLAPFYDQVVDAEREREPLPMTFGDYVETLEWTVAALRQQSADRESQLAVKDLAEQQPAPDTVTADPPQEPSWSRPQRTMKVETEAPLAPPSMDSASQMLKTASSQPRLLRHLGLDAVGFLGALQNFPRSFFTMVGHVQLIDTVAKRRGYKRRPGREAARRLYSARSA
ncbi:MAG TPA: hypothetical protein VEB21_00660, partial [Terriglobales bacterium]|nr:hypothetical protein [Terriglobales bacterium]